MKQIIFIFINFHLRYVYMILFAMYYIADQTTNLRVSLTDTDPQTDPPTLTNYNQCTYNHGILDPGVTTELMCDNGPVAGRYLIIQSETAFGFLTLCEVQVFAGKPILLHCNIMSSQSG